MQTKLKVGDKVEIVSTLCNNEKCTHDVGDNGTVVDVSTMDYRIDVGGVLNP